MSEYSDLPADAVSELRRICSALPETAEEKAWAGTRWRVRKRTFVHGLTATHPVRGDTAVITFRSAEPELSVLRSAGHPFFSPGWGTNVIGMVLGDGVDWDEVAELLTESYCILAPKKLAALVDRPEPGPEPEPDHG